MKKTLFVFLFFCACSSSGVKSINCTSAFVPMGENLVLYEGAIKTTWQVYQKPGEPKNVYVEDLLRTEKKTIPDTSYWVKISLSFFASIEVKRTTLDGHQGVLVKWPFLILSML